jgi:two-component system sensor histidine kinase BaeS
MIRFTIQRKVFFATFALAAAMAALLLGLTRWNLQQGFSRYVVETEISKLDWLVKNVEDAYEQNGSWAFLQGRGEAWARLAGRQGREGAGQRPLPPPFRGPPGAENFPGPPEFEGRPPPGEAPPPRRGPPPGAEGGPDSGPGTGPRPDALGIHPRISVRDLSGKVLAGNLQPDALSATRPIRHQGQTVGNLVLQAPRSEDARDAAFLATQTRDLWLSGFAGLFLSLLAAWLLARHFLGPIRALASGARQIAEGRFDERIPVERSDELGELASDFNAMAEMLARTEEFRRQWVSDSSHELRTPIAVLRAEIEALQDGVRTTDEKTLARLHKHVMQMSKLVDDLRQTLDRDSGQADLSLASIEPLSLLRETLEEFLPRFTMATVTLDIASLPQNDPRWRIQGDADRLQQVFANLLENTLRYTHPAGRLKVSAASRGGTLQLQFDDTPPAPPEKAIPRLFERFFRAEPSRSREHGGSGLGLAICKTIVEGHGGSISASRSVLGGLCVRIDLPLET